MNISNLKAPKFMVDTNLSLKEFHFCLQAVDISPNPGRSDPMYIVYSRKLSTA